MDEEHERYRTTPKAFVSLQQGSRCCRRDMDQMTSIRVRPEAGQSLTAARDHIQRLSAAADPLAFGVAVIDVRQQGLEGFHAAPRTSVSIVYFSFFIVVSALLLVACSSSWVSSSAFAKWGCSGRWGVGPARVRWLFLQEGVLLAVIGSILGVAGAIGYAWLMMFGLRSWWVDAARNHSAHAACLTGVDRRRCCASWQRLPASGGRREVIASRNAACSWGRSMRPSH